ncbi:MAG TPA: replicative DNA helicase [Caulobacterales bacterium]|nr:replicative DNA helicase [Caulobacterales bacterium]
MSADGSLPAPPRTAPHNLDAEQGLLGAILYDNETFNRIGDRLRPQHFYDPVHGRIFEVCVNMISRGKLADGVTLREHFMREAALAEIGGAAYLLTLVQNAAKLISHAQEYAEIIYDLALRRELIRIGEDIAREAATPVVNESGVAQIEEAERSLFTLAQSGGASKGFDDFSVALAISIEMTAAAYETKAGISGIATGLTDLDRQLGGLHPSDLIILAGRPSMGKTALAANIAFNVARARNHSAREGKTGKDAAGGVVGFFSLEMSAEQLATRLLSEFAEIESSRIRRGEIQKHEYEKLKDAAAELQAIPLHIDETGGISIAALQARARRLQRTHGLDLIVVDYLQLVTASNRRSEGRVQEVSEITQGLKALAKDLKVPVIALSQLSRQVELREDKRPQLADLRESGSIEQDADVVLFVYREEYYLARQEPKLNTPEHVAWQTELDSIRNKAEVIVGKQRHGPIGKVDLIFDNRFTKFSSVARGS